VEYAERHLKDKEDRDALIDRVSGDALAITLWADEAAMRASEERANELRRVASEQLGAAAPPRVHRYEVAVFENS